MCLNPAGPPSRAGRAMARPAGLEPATYGFEVRRSIQLSYGRTNEKYNGKAPRKGRAGPVIAYWPVTVITRLVSPQADATRLLARLTDEIRQMYAVRVYERAGYRRTPPYGVYVNWVGSLCFSKNLVPTS